MVSIQDACQPRGPHDGGIAVLAKRRPFYNDHYYVVHYRHSKDKDYNQDLT